MYICSACFVDDIVLTVYVHVLHSSTTYPMPRSFYVFYGLFLMLLTIFGRYFYRTLRMLRAKITGQKTDRKNVLIVGAGSAGNLLIKEMVDAR